ncbi:MAG: biotin--[acetyl-CoA-carboxylase] ligase [Bacteroidales bacterium]|jgi:BirA family biotin operon repressor/biotin-[acetyl-CoA-carboxylase] ligase|nr:biotin--[acetyl-CoA-carboxylase] ligase [Bacteroidales bacterium]
MHNKNRHIIHLSEVNSTNDYMKELVKHGHLAEGTMVRADHQTAGKGVDLNTWESEAGKNILLSLILFPDFIPAEKQFSISMAIALGITDFLADQLPNENILVKWPNDVYAGGKKIAGILIANEILGMKIEHVIVGIGLNVNQETFSKNIPNPASMTNLSGNFFDLEKMTFKLRDCVIMRYEQLRTGLSDLIRRDYYSRLLGLNENRKFHYKGNEIDAVITGVDEFGRLQLETDSGKIVCDLKEISFIL